MKKLKLKCAAANNTENSFSELYESIGCLARPISTMKLTLFKLFIFIRISPFLMSDICPINKSFKMLLKIRLSCLFVRETICFVNEFGSP